MRKALTPLIGVLVGLAFLIPVAIGLMQGRVIEIELVKPKTAKEALQQAYTKHFQEKDYQRAIEKYRWVVEKFPESEEAVEAQYRIGNIYQWDLVEPEKAIQEYEKLKERYPNSDYAIAALIRIGESYGRVKQYDKSIQCFKQVVDRYPNTEYALKAKMEIANTLLHCMDELSKALEIYQEIVKTSPDSRYAVEAQLWIANIRWKQGEYSDKKVIEICKKIISSYQNYYHICSAAQYMIGYVLYMRGKHDEALNEFRKVLIQYPESYYDHKAETHLFIGFLHELRNNVFVNRKGAHLTIEKRPI